MATAKSAAALLTGSASMFAESAHSWADTGNQVLTLVADRRSRRKPIGVLLGTIAIVLIERNRDFLLGEGVSQQLWDETHGRLAMHPAVDKVTYLFMEHAGPEQFCAVAAASPATTRSPQLRTTSVHWRRT